MPDSEVPDFDTTQETRIGRDWLKSVVLWVLCIVMCLIAAYGVQIEVDGPIDQRFQTGSWFLLTTMGLFAVWVSFRLVIPFGALVILGPHGIADRRINPDLIPWTEVTNIASKSDFVTLTLTQKFSKSYRLSPSQRVLKALQKTAGPRHVKIAAWCLASRQSELASHAAAFHRDHSRLPSRA